MTGWIKLYRKFLQWEWSDIPEMVALFIHLLLMANTNDWEWHGQKYQKGQLITSVKSLSKKTGLSVRQVRYCLERLKLTNEVAIKTTNKNSIITICKYESYQSVDLEIGKQSGKQIDKQVANKWQTNGKQMATDKEYKNINNTRNVEKESIKEKDAAEAATNEQKLLQRKNNFLNELSQYISVYGEEMVSAFADYWTEANRSQTKMRFELEKTWELRRRLVTWASRNRISTARAAYHTDNSGGKISPMQALKNMAEKYARNKIEDAEDYKIMPN